MNEEPNVRIEFFDIPEEEKSEIIRYIQDTLYEVKKNRKNNSDVEKTRQSVTVYSDFAFDSHSDISNDKESTIQKVAPVYERLMDASLPLLEDVQMISIKKCFNCGRPDHESGKCREPRDNHSFQKNRELFMQQFDKYRNRGPSAPRYYKAIEQEREERRRDSSRSPSPKRRRTRSKSPPRETSTNRSHRERSRSPVEVIVIDPEPTPAAPQEPAEPSIPSQQIYEENPKFVKDVGTVSDQFLFGGELVQDPKWKEQFNSLMKRLKTHSSNKQDERRSVWGEVEEKKKQPTRIRGKRRRSDDYDERDSDRYDRKRSRSRSPSYSRRSSYGNRDSYRSESRRHR